MGSTADRLRNARLMAVVSPPLLTCHVDLEALVLRCVVALVPGIGDDPLEASADGVLDVGEDRCERVPVIRISGERLHVGDKLAAPAAVEGRRHADLDAELIGFVGLAFANALDLRSMQRVELPATLALALILDPASPRERQREHVCEFRSADDLAGDVADDAPEHRADAPQGSVGPLELLGVGIALVPDQRDLADPHVRLAQGHAPRLGEAHQALACAMHQLGVRRKGNRLLLHGRVDDHLPEVRGLGGSHAGRDGQALLDQRDELVLPHALAPARQRRAVERKLMTEELLAAEQLVVRVLDPALA